MVWVVVNASNPGESGGGDAIGASCGVKRMKLKKVSSQAGAALRISGGALFAWWFIRETLRHAGVL